MSAAAPRGRALIEEEIADLESLLAGFPDDLKNGPFGAPYFVRLGDLRDELHDSQILESTYVDSVVDVRFDRVRGLTMLPAQFVGRFIQIWQALYDSLGQAATGRITRFGTIGREITDQTRLMVVPFVPGSFVVRLSLDRSGPPQTEDLGRRAFDMLEALVDAGDDERRLALELARLRSRVASNYAKILDLLVEAQVDLGVKTVADATQRTVRRVRVRHENAVRALPVLRSVVAAQREELVIEAKLNAANSRTGAFELDLGEEGTVTGKATPSVNMNGLQIGSFYRFQIIKLVQRNEATGDFAEDYIMTGFGPLGR